MRGRLIDKRPDKQPDRYHMLYRLHVATLIGVGFIFVYSLRFAQSRDWLSIAGVGVLSAGAFLLAGFLLGFVFGLPRTPDSSHERPQAGAAPQGPRSTKPSIQSNNNLLEISDWLTKIIVGVGLVQLNKIPGKIKDLTTYIGNGLRDCETPACKQSSEALALGIIIFFFSAGFLNRISLGTSLL